MQAVSDAVSEMSKYDDVRSVDGYTERITRGTVAVVFRIERPAKYEIGFDGYASNLNANRWFSVSGTARDTFMDGDTAAAKCASAPHGAECCATSRPSASTATNGG